LEPVTADLPRMPVKQPSISVIIPTRDRPGDVKRALDALLRCTHPAFEILVVVDPQESGTTAAHLPSMLPAAGGTWHQCTTRIAEAVYESEGGTRLTLLRSPRRGTSSARNTGAEQARGSLLAFTDDDCTVPVDWLACIEDAFARGDAPGLLCGPMVAAPHDSARVHIPEFLPPRSERIVRRSVRPWSLGVSANMAMAGETFFDLGGFDTRLGPGTPQHGEDTQLAYRVLQARLGLHVEAFNPVTHWGARLVESGASTRLLRESWFGVGACYGLLFAEGDPVAPLVVAREIRSLLAGMAVTRLRGCSPPDYMLLAIVIRGFARGMRVSREPAIRPRALARPADQ
jgi:hypothetical protein